MTSRHRGTYGPSNPAPYQLNRSHIENFVRCQSAVLTLMQSLIRIFYKKLALKK